VKDNWELSGKHGTSTLARPFVFGSHQTRLTGLAEYHEDYNLREERPLQPSERTGKLSEGLVGAGGTILAVAGPAGGVVKGLRPAPKKTVFTNTDGPVDLNRPPGKGTSGGVGGTHVTDADLSDPNVLPPFADGAIPGGIKSRVTEIEVPNSALRPDPTGGNHGTSWIPPNSPGAKIIREWDVHLNDDVFPVEFDIRPRR
jgi:hypothetical protein